MLHFILVWVRVNIRARIVSKGMVSVYGNK